MLILTLFLLFAAFVAPVAAQTAGDYAVAGQVTNGTPGGAVPVGAPVVLRFFTESAWTPAYTTTLSAEGRFRFDDLAAEAGRDFVAQVTHAGVDYFSSPASLEGEVEADVLIFEPTTDPSDVQVDQAHFFIVPGGERVQIAEYYLLGNAGDRAYVGAATEAGQRATLRFDLPSEAQNLTFDGPGLGERFVPHAGGGFSDTRAVLPGSATIEVGFSYELPYREGLAVARALEVPVASAVILVNSESVGLAGAGLTFNGMMDTQMGASAAYVAGPLAAGETLAFTFVPQQASLDGDAPAGVARPPRVAAREVGLGLAALALAGLASYWLWQPGSPPPPPASARPLVAEIARLDREFEAGALDEAAYQEQRAALKRRVNESRRIS